jgi:hypothetical protein
MSSAVYALHVDHTDTKASGGPPDGTVSLWSLRKCLCYDGTIVALYEDADKFLSAVFHDVSRSKPCICVGNVPWLKMYAFRRFARNSTGVSQCCIKVAAHRNLYA